MKNPSIKATLTWILFILYVEFLWQISYLQKTNVFTYLKIVHTDLQILLCLKLTRSYTMPYKVNSGFVCCFIRLRNLFGNYSYLQLQLQLQPVNFFIGCNVFFITSSGMFDLFSFWFFLCMTWMLFVTFVCILINMKVTINPF